MNNKEYPKINFNQIIHGQGTHTKEILIPTSFIKETNKMFLPAKTASLLSTKNAAIHKNNGYLLELLFHGLNYSAKRIRRRRAKYFCDLHRSEVFICHEQTANTFKSTVHKRRLIFFSFDQQLINRIKIMIKAFKIPNTYTGKGILERDDMYKTREGKKR